MKRQAKREPVGAAPTRRGDGGGRATVLDWPPPSTAEPAELTALRQALDDPSLPKALNSVARLAGGELAIWTLDGEQLFTTGEESVPPSHASGCETLQVGGRRVAELAVLGVGDECACDARTAAMHVLSGHLTLEVQNEELSGELLGKLSELTALYGVSETLASSRDRNEVAEVMLNTAAELLAPSWGCVIAHDHDDGQLRVAATSTEPGAVPTRPWRPVDASSLAWRAMNQSQALLFSEMSATERELLHHDVGSIAKRAGSALIAPMHAAGTSYGALVLMRTSDRPDFSSADLKLVSALGLQGAVSTAHLRLYQQSKEMFLATVWALASAVDAKDSYTHGHSQRVAKYAAALGKALGMSEDGVERLELSAVLHDVGKIGVPEAILNKEGRLTAAEMAIMRGHPEKGATILGSIPAMRDVVPGVLHHHERWDGLGYPDGLKGEAIPLNARIILIADTFDAMTSTRPYRKGLSLEIAVDELRRCSGTQFDPNLVETYIELFEGGSLRILADEQNPSGGTESGASGS